MPIDLRNIGSISPNGGGTITVPGNVNITGTPAPQFLVNGVPIGGGGQNQTPWLSNIDAARFRLDNLGTTTWVSPNGTYSGQFSMNNVGNANYDFTQGSLQFYATNVSMIAQVGSVILQSNAATGVALRVNTGAASNAFFLMANGFLGLGHNNPPYRLQVQGDVNLSAGSVYRIDGVPIGGGSSQWTDIAGGGIYYNGGPVGIGTATPLAGLPSPGLHVVGVGGILAEATDGAYIQVKNAAGGYKGLMGRRSDNIADFFIGHFGISGGNMLLATDDGAGNLIERMRITEAGNVAIGGIPTIAKLEIRSNSDLDTANALRIWSANGTQSADYSFGGISSSYWYRIQAGAGFPVTLQPNGGNVGIGVLTPATGRLEIQSLNPTDPWIGAQIILREATVNPDFGLALGFITASGGWLGSIQSRSGGLPAWLNLNPQGGYVGVNATAPQATLDTGAALAPIKVATYGAPGQVYGIGVDSFTLTFGANIDANVGVPQMRLVTNPSNTGTLVVNHSAVFDPGNSHLQVIGGLCVNAMADNNLACIRMVSLDQAWGVGWHFPGQTCYLFATNPWDAYGGWAQWIMNFDCGTGSVTIPTLSVTTGNIGSLTTNAIQCNGNLNAGSITINGQPLALMTEWSRFDPSFLSSSGGVVGITDWKYGLFQIVGNFLYFWASCFVSASSPWVNLMRLPQPYINTNDAAASAFAGWGGAISVPLANATLVLFSSVQCWQFGWITPGITFSIHGHYRIA